jgi:predicted nucleic-acid-binding protein
MIGLDTNILARYLAQDDVKQAAQATHLMEKTLTVTEPGFISLIVLTELYWVLNKLYSVSSPEWLDTVDELLASQSLQIEQREVVQAAVLLCRHSKASYVDALISQVARAAGCGQTVSFDKAAIRYAEMVTLKL